MAADPYYYITDITLSATCEDYTIEVEGVSIAGHNKIEYDLYLGSDIVASGEFFVGIGNFDETITEPWPPGTFVECGSYHITSEFYMPCDVYEYPEADVYCPCDGCTRTPGYWRNHPDEWPVDEITIGGVTYTKGVAIIYLQTRTAGDKSLTMFKALVAAKLNALAGADTSCIAETIAAADAWMLENPVGSNVPGGGVDSPWRDGEPLKNALDDYNNGLLCAPYCD
jgi:hypothetical protein